MSLPTVSVTVESGPSPHLEQRTLRANVSYEIRPTSSITPPSNITYGIRVCPEYDGQFWSSSALIHLCIPFPPPPRPAALTKTQQSQTKPA